MASTVRSVDVRLNAMVAGYIRDVKRAGDATEKSFDKVHASTSRARESIVDTDKAMGRLGSTTRLTSPSQRRLASDVDRLSVAAVRGSASIDKYSGRIRILGELLATIGPGLLPLGAGGAVALAGLAGLFGGVTVGALGLLVAVQGVGDALKAVEKARLEPTADNLRAAEDAMSRMAPQAREFVNRFQELRPVLKDIRDAGAEQFFPGLTASLDSLEKLAPMLEQIVAVSGRAGGSTIAKGAESLASERWAPFFEFLTNEIPDAIDDASRLVGSLAHGATEMWMAFDPTNDRFIDWLVDVADGFDDWASSKGGREDIRDFLAYVEQTGPKVGDFFVAAADALAQMAQAAAPLSGPVLEGLTAIAKVVAAIADSDLGTPILAGVAALTLYTRGLQAAVAIQTKLNGAAGANGLARGGALGSLQTGLTKAQSTASRLRSDLAVLGPSYATVATRGERASVAAKSLRSNLGGLGKGTALVGGLALASSGAADGIGLTNTASLALMGTIAGPWGAAVGGGIGLMLDLAKAAGEYADAQTRATAAMTSGNIEQINAALAEQQKILAGTLDSDKVSGVGDFFSDIWRGVSGGGSGDTKKKAIEQIEQLEDALTGAYDSQSRIATDHSIEQWAAATGDAFINLAADMEKPSLSLDKLLERMRAQGRAAAEMGQNIRTALRNGADPAALQRIIDELGPQAGLAIEELAKGGEQAAGRFNRAWGVAEVGLSKVETAIGKVGQAIVRLPNGTMLRVTADTIQARTAIERIKAQIAGIKDKTVRVNAYVNYLNAGALRTSGGRDGDPATPYAGGGPVRGPGGPQEDAIAARLSNGEYVIKAAAVDRYGVGLFDGLNAMRFAIGGPVGQTSSASMHPAYTPVAATSGSWANDPALIQRLAAIEYAINHGTAVNSGEQHANRKNNKAGVATAARAQSRGYMP